MNEGLPWLWEVYTNCGWHERYGVDFATVAAGYAAGEAAAYGNELMRGDLVPRMTAEAVPTPAWVPPGLVRVGISDDMFQENTLGTAWLQQTERDAAIMAVGVGFVMGLATAGSAGSHRKITMDEAMDKAIEHVGGDATMEETRGGNYQFRSRSVDSQGRTVWKMGRLDVNLADDHVRISGPHLNIETHVAGGGSTDVHYPIIPSTIRGGGPSVIRRYCGQPLGIGVVGRYSKGGVNLEADAAALASLADGLSSGSACRVWALCVPTDTAPEPYEGFLAALRMVVDEGPVRIERERDTMVMTGAMVHLRAVANRIRSIVASAPLPPHPGYHGHIEHIPEAIEYVAPSALPLVITVLLERPACADDATGFIVPPEA